jgi:hypothetical protein
VIDGALRLLAVGALVSGPAFAQQLHRLDDSTSPRQQVQARIDDTPLTRQRGPALQVAFGRIEFRLTTGPYVGRKARIHFVIPPVIEGLRSPAGVQVQWRGGHLFADGLARPGERRQVWSGVVRDTFMSDSLELSLELDAQRLRVLPGANLGFESYFEIEVLP